MGEPVTFTINLTKETLVGFLIDDDLITYRDEFNGLHVVGVEHVTIEG